MFSEQIFFSSFSCVADKSLVHLPSTYLRNTYPFSFNHIPSYEHLYLFLESAYRYQP